MIFEHAREWWRGVLGSRQERPEKPALVLSGGGPRCAYQAGVLRYLSERYPDLNFPIVTGVSGGSINAAGLAAYAGSLAGAVEHLASLWSNATSDRVFESEQNVKAILRFIMRQAFRGNEAPRTPEVGGFMNTEPLRVMLKTALNAPDGTLEGISRNIQEGRLDAIAIITTNYLTGQTVSWVQGRDLHNWERPHRKSVQTELTVEHVMASSALPIVFPAVKIGDDWYGDGGIRLTAPLAPALHLGADRILALSTRYQPTMAEAQERDSTGYPPPARVVGLLLNAIFLDSLEQDAMTLERINHFVRHVPRSRRAGYREVDLLMMRPSIDLATLASPVESKVGGALKTLLRVMGTDLTKTPDWVSLVVFDPEYIGVAMEVGFNDAHLRRADTDRFFEDLF